VATSHLHWLTVLGAACQSVCLMASCALGHEAYLFPCEECMSHMQEMLQGPSHCLQKKQAK
jgi:hypothetical protein